MASYNIDSGTNEVDAVSGILGYLDGSEMSLIMGKSMTFLNIGIFGLEIAMIVYDFYY
jgi:hypothetical protein